MSSFKKIEFSPKIKLGAHQAGKCLSILKSYNLSSNFIPFKHFNLIYLLHNCNLFNIIDLFNIIFNLTGHFSTMKTILKRINTQWLGIYDSMDMARNL